MDSQSNDEVDIDAVAKKLSEDLITETDLSASQLDDGRRFDVDSDRLDSAARVDTDDIRDEQAKADSDNSFSERERGSDGEGGDVAGSDKIGRWTFSKGAAKNTGKSSKPKHVVDGNFEHLKAKRAPTKKEQEALESEAQRAIRNTEVRFPYRNSSQKTFTDFLRSRQSTFAQSALAQLERDEQQKQARLAARRKPNDAAKQPELDVLPPATGEMAQAPEVSHAAPEPDAVESTVQPIALDTVPQANCEPETVAESRRLPAINETTVLGDLNLTQIARCADESHAPKDDEDLLDDTVIVHNRAVSTPQRAALDASPTLRSRNRIGLSSNARATALRMRDSAFDSDQQGSERFSLRALKQRALQQQCTVSDGDSAQPPRLAKIDENAEIIEFEIARPVTSTETEMLEIEMFKERVVHGTVPDARNKTTANTNSNGAEATTEAKKTELKNWLETGMAKQREEARRERERAYRLENEERVGEDNGSEQSDQDAADDEEVDEEDEDDSGDTESEPDDEEAIPLEQLGVARDGQPEECEVNCEFVDKEAEEASSAESELDSEFGHGAYDSDASSESALPNTAASQRIVRNAQSPNGQELMEANATPNQKQRKRLLFYDSDDEDCQTSDSEAPAGAGDTELDGVAQPKGPPLSGEAERATRTATPASSVNELHTQTSMFEVDAEGFVIPKVRWNIDDGDEPADDDNESDAPIGGLTQLLGADSRRGADADNDAEGGSLQLASAIQFCSGAFAEPPPSSARRQHGSKSATVVESKADEGIKSESIIKEDVAKLRHDSDADDDDDEEVTTRTRTKKRKIIMNDDDDEDTGNNNPSKAHVDELNESAQTADGDTTKQTDKGADADGDGLKRKKFRGFRSSRTGRLRSDFIDAEAELTSEDESDVSADEDETELVQRLLAEEQADPKQRVLFVNDDQRDADESMPQDANELRRQVERIHLKRAIDDDQRDLRFFKEKFLHDADHEELTGPGRTRLFRWRGLMNPDAENWVMSDSDNEVEMDDTVLANGGFNWETIRNRLGQKFAAQSAQTQAQSETSASHTDAETHANADKDADFRPLALESAERERGNGRIDENASSPDAVTDEERARMRRTAASPTHSKTQQTRPGGETLAHKAHAERPNWDASVNDSGDGAMLERLYSKYSADSSFLRRTFRVLHERAGGLRRSTSVADAARVNTAATVATGAVTAGAGGAHVQRASLNRLTSLNDLNPLDRAKLIGRSIMRNSPSTTAVSDVGKQVETNSNPKREETSTKVNPFNRKRGLFSLTSEQKQSEFQPKRARAMEEQQSAIAVPHDAQSLAASARLQRSFSMPTACDQLVRRSNAKQGSVFAFLK